jgi:hypothetical protein
MAEPQSPSQVLRILPAQYTGHLISSLIELVESHDPIEPLPPKANARRTDPDTSHEAAASFSEKRLTAIQGDVLSFFRQVRRATDEELERVLLVKYPGFSTLRKRRTDLLQMGLLRDSGQRKRNASGHNMILWELSI